MYVEVKNRSSPRKIAVSAPLQPSESEQTSMHPFILRGSSVLAGFEFPALAFATKSKRPQECATRESSVSMVRLLESAAHVRIITVRFPDSENEFGCFPSIGVRDLVSQIKITSNVIALFAVFEAAIKSHFDSN